MAKSHLLPFLWLHGEGDETLRQGVREIKRTGCGAFCAESRVHPEFLGPAWWHEMEVLLEEAKRQGLPFYLLDDTCFPSGYANGAGADTPFQRRMMTERHADLRGPLKGGRMVVYPDGMTGTPVAVLAGRRLEHGNRVESFVDLGGFALTDMRDLTSLVEDGLLRWDVPEGIWRVFVLTAEYVSERTPARKFLNPLLKDSSRLMIETVYRPHADFFGAECGRTFLGFFSDEPALRAGRGSHAVLGEYPRLPIPWRDDLPRLLSDALGQDAVPLLAGLWYDIGPMTPRIRYALMDTVSRLYGENYSMPLGDWCRERGLEYVGHVIEQNNAHSRLGQGAGHYFRAVSGQTMSGMDYVLHELKPDFSGGWHAWHSQEFEAEDDFFRFMLPQMTASAAALDPKKQGRALCECFGAYGWQEDAGQMRYMANLLLSRGINYFVPHAFSLKPVPDPDSPPHFGPFHPLEPFFARLFGQMERTAALIDGGRHDANVAVLYYAEAEWACGSGVMKTQRVVRLLEEAQIPCQVVPIDALEMGTWDALLIPGAERWPRKLFEILPRLKERGCRTAFVGQAPTGFCDGPGSPEEGETVALEEAAAWCRRGCDMAVRPMGRFPQIHVYPYLREDGPLTLFFNESFREQASFEGEVRGIFHPLLYDPEGERSFEVPFEPTKKGCLVRLTLEPGQLVVLTDPRAGLPQAEKQVPLTLGPLLRPRWCVTFPDEPGLPPEETEDPQDLMKRWPRFSGTVRYRAEVSLPASEGIALPHVYGAVRVFADGRDLGVRVSPPYRFPAVFGAGRHTLEVEVTCAPGARWRDPLSFHGWLPPAGLTGPIALLKRKEENGLDRA